MTKQTEQHEQEFIDAYIEAERQPRKDVPEVAGRIILERTDVAQQGFDSEGTYIDGSW